MARFLKELSTVKLAAGNWKGANRIPVFTSIM
jgi:hypothetical protein